MFSSKNNNKGFTLIELSVVLVILAVLVGAVLTGQSLIKTAELNAFVGDIERFKSAFSRFQAQYRQLPGDMDNAFDYWACDCAVDTTCGPDAGDAAFCNGDGDLSIVAGEGLKAWKQLSLSGLIDDHILLIDAEPYTDFDCYQGETNPIMALPVVLNFSSFNDYEDLVSSTSVPVAGQVMVAGRDVGDNGGGFEDCPFNGGPAFTAEELYIMDKKMDDGFAYSGRIVNSQNDTGCTASVNVDENDLDNGDYDLANNGTNLCYLFVRLKVD